VKIYTPPRNIALFLIISLVFIALLYNNNSFSSLYIIFNIPYPTARAIPNLQANNNNNISTSGPNGTSNTNVVPSINHPPVAKVGPDQTVNENATVNLVGFAIDPDPDDKVSYSWMQIAGPAIALTAANTDTPSFTAPYNLPSDTPLKFTLTAKDNKGAESTNPATVTILVKHINHPPIANASQDQTVNPGYVVSLDGTKSNDPDGDQLNYSWIQTTGPNVTLNGADKPIATFTAPKDISSDTDMLFKLTVTDDKGATNTATAKVTVKYIPPANQSPIANAGTDQTVNSGDTVTLDGSGSTDPDGNIASYSWMQTAGPSVVLNDANTATPSFTAPTVSSDTELKFSLTVIDDKGSISTDNVQVTVKYVPPSPANAPTAEIQEQGQQEQIESTTQVWNPACGQVVEGLVEFNSDLICNYDGLIVGADNTTIRLNGHTLRESDPLSSNVGISVYDNNGIKIEGPGKIEGFQYGIIISDSVGTSISSMNLTLNQIGISSNSSKGLEIKDNLLTGDVLNGILLMSTTDSLILKNNVEKSQNGIFVDAMSQYNTIESNDVHKNAVDLNNADGLATNVNANDFFDNNCEISNPVGLCIAEANPLQSTQTPPPSNISTTGETSQSSKEQYSYVRTWGSQGSGERQFNSPVAVAIDASENIYVSDNDNGLIQKFDNRGNFITQWTFNSSNNATSVGASHYDNYVYVADGGFNNIQKFDSNGNFISKWDSEGKGNGQFSDPSSGIIGSSGTGVAIDSSGNVYAADSGNNRIQVFSPSS